MRQAEGSFRWASGSVQRDRPSQSWVDLDVRYPQGTIRAHDASIEVPIHLLIPRPRPHSPSYCALLLDRQARARCRLLRPQEGDADRSKAPPGAPRRHELRVRVEPLQTCGRPWTIPPQVYPIASSQRLTTASTRSPTPFGPYRTGWFVSSTCQVVH